LGAVRHLRRLAVLLRLRRPLEEQVAPVLF
jgi:hypothetical protein